VKPRSRQLPDWLVERAALGELPDHNRMRLDAADPAELAPRVAAIAAANAAELAAFPAGPAVAQLEARAAAARQRRRTERRARLAAVLGVAATAAAVALLAGRALVATPSIDATAELEPPEVTRAKGGARLLIFRQILDREELLVEDALVRAGDVVQLKYSAGDQRFGVIASVDGAGVVTLHFPDREGAPPEATAVRGETTTLPTGYALDAAPRFERFFFLTADEPIDVAETLGALRRFARQPDSATATPALPDHLHSWSLRLRKPDRRRR
jgi:hypothetical protein